MNLVEAIELHLPRGFTIEGQLGAGGTSSVYLARAADRGERIVVKVMLPGTVTDDTVDRFLREMRILKLLDHPRVVRMLEPGEANGAIFFTMPYIDGETLRARLRARGPLAVVDALRVARDLADALSHVHGRGVVHRDVKPDNVLLARDGGAYLIDFGFASAAALGNGAIPGRDARLVMGTPGYMSPEQASGRLDEDARTDIFSLGCVMFESLTGRGPFPSADRTAAMRRGDASAPPPEDVRRLRPDVPDAVAAIIRRNLGTHPSSRFATAGALRSALDAALERLASNGGVAASG
jgi:serine/threonine-protein kinase